MSPNAAAPGLVVINDYVSFCLPAGVWGRVSPVGGAQVWNKCSLLFFFFLIVFNTLFIYFIYLFMTVLGLLVFV